MTSLRTSLRPVGATVVAIMFAVLLVVLPGTQSAASASAGPTGPPLSVPRQALDEAVSYTPDVYPGSGKKVVLVGGVGFGPADAWGWGYAQALARDGYGVCDVTVLDHDRGDATIGAEYVVHAIHHAPAEPALPPYAEEG